MPALKPEQFPQLTHYTKAKWAPVLLSPIMGSPEQLVIGVAAVSSDAAHLEGANALRRLECLYGKLADTAIFAAEVALEELQDDLARRRLDALTNPKPGFSGVTIGPISEGEGNSVEHVARTWLASLSSLYSSGFALAAHAATLADVTLSAELSVTDRLPTLVLDYVTGKRPGLAQFFNDNIREKKQRRRTKAHGVFIDFAGSHIVANFGTLMASRQAASVDKLKQRMWDLVVDRDSESGSITSRLREMICQRPSREDPQVTEGQYDTIEEAVGALSEQARREEIGFRPMTTVAQIGDHILEAEKRGGRVG